MVINGKDKISEYINQYPALEEHFAEWLKNIAEKEKERHANVLSF